MNTENNATFVISLNLHNQRLDQALVKLLPNYSRTQLQHWVTDGSITLNGRQVKPKAKVSCNDVIAAHIVETVRTPNQAENMPLNVVFEDESLLVVNKPVGLVVHPGAGNKDHTLLNALLHHAPELSL